MYSYVFYLLVHVLCKCYPEVIFIAASDAPFLLLQKSVTGICHCQVLAIDLRGHGECINT